MFAVFVAILGARSGRARSFTFVKVFRYTFRFVYMFLSVVVVVARHSTSLSKGDVCAS